MQTEFLILGQGISGTLLSRELIKNGRSVAVIDDATPSSASRVAGGLISPVTGKRWATQHDLQHWLHAALTCYKAIEQEHNVSILRELSQLVFHGSAQEEEAFDIRVRAGSPWMHRYSLQQSWQSIFNSSDGIGKVTPCYLVDLTVLLATWRNYLANETALREEHFSWAHLDINERGVQYKDINASMLICCDGAAAMDNPLFASWPFAVTKGEALVARIPSLSRDHVYTNGIKIMPWRDDFFWIGASSEHTFSDARPSVPFRENTVANLKQWLKLPFSIEGHYAALRPTTTLRQQFVQIHPDLPRVGICNGMGTRACLIAPLLAQNMAGLLECY